LFLNFAGIETKFKKQHYTVLVCATHVPELLHVQREAAGIRVGASTTLSHLHTILSKAVEDMPGKTEDYHVGGGGGGGVGGGRG
jgi:xanthine dehydrogenase iron-sulfur cluster and FAD-binding subunit A